MIIIHNNSTFKLVLYLLLCRGIMAYNTNRYILILGESIRTNVLFGVATNSMATRRVRSTVSFYPSPYHVKIRSELVIDDCYHDQNKFAVSITKIQSELVKYIIG